MGGRRQRSVFVDNAVPYLYCICTIVSSDDFTALSLEEGLQMVRGYRSLVVKEGPQLLSQPISFPKEALINTSDTSGMASAVLAAAASDIAVLAVGEHGFQSGEGRSSLNLHLPGLQEELIRRVLAVQENVVLVVYVPDDGDLPRHLVMLASLHGLGSGLEYTNNLPRVEVFIFLLHHTSIIVGKEPTVRTASLVQHSV